MKEFFWLILKKKNTTVSGTYYAAKVAGKYSGRTSKKMNKSFAVVER